MDASVVFCVVCQTYTYYTTEAFLWDFVHRHLRTRFSPALLGVWDCFNQHIGVIFQSYFRLQHYSTRIISHKSGVVKQLSVEAKFNQCRQLAWEM